LCPCSIPLKTPRQYEAVQKLTNEEARSLLGSTIGLEDLCTTTVFTEDVDIWYPGTDCLVLMAVFRKGVVKTEVQRVIKNVIMETVRLLAPRFHRGNSSRSCGAHISEFFGMTHGKGGLEWAFPDAGPLPTDTPAAQAEPPVPSLKQPLFDETKRLADLDEDQRTGVNFVAKQMSVLLRSAAYGNNGVGCMQKIAEAKSAFVFPDSLFTYIFANKNFITDLHDDSGDLREGFTALTVMEEGNYQGSFTVLPAYDIAFNIRQGDLLLLRSQVEIHGNSPKLGTGTRWAFIFGMHNRIRNARQPSRSKTAQKHPTKAQSRAERSKKRSKTKRTSTRNVTKLGAGKMLQCLQNTASEHVQRQILHTYLAGTGWRARLNQLVCCFQLKVDTDGYKNDAIATFLSQIRKQK